LSSGFRGIAILAVDYGNFQNPDPFPWVPCIGIEIDPCRFKTDFDPDHLSIGTSSYKSLCAEPAKLAAKKTKRAPPDAAEPFLLRLQLTRFVTSH
jgi:hypothetical protein